MNVLELERGSSGDVENLFGRDCGHCGPVCKTDYIMNE